METRKPIVTFGKFPINNQIAPANLK